jgi:hypothetical protein
LQKGISDEDLKRRFKASDDQLRTAHVLVSTAEAAGQASPAGRGETSQVEVEIVNRVGELAEDLLQQRRNAAFKRGDLVEVTENNTPIRLRRRKTINANKKDTYRVIASLPNIVIIEVPGGDNGAIQRGRIPLDRVQLKQSEPRGEGRPVLRAIGEIITESELDVITMVERGY